MNNEPVAWMNENNHIVGGKIPPNDFVYSWKPLYTLPVIEVMEFEVNKVAYWDGKVPNSTGLSYFKTATCKAPLYTRSTKTLTDEEINKLWKESREDGIAMQQGFTTQQHYFAHLILKKASEK
jgi:hypothetical protein